MGNVAAAGGGHQQNRAAQRPKQQNQAAGVLQLAQALTVLGGQGRGLARQARSRCRCRRCRWLQGRAGALGELQGAWKRSVSAPVQGGGTGRAGRPQTPAHHREGAGGAR